MEKIKILGTIFIGFLILIGGCGGCSDPSPQITRPKPKPINIIVILDTSDRISHRENPTQVETDVLITKGITNLYYEHILRQRGDWRNRVVFVVPPQSGRPKIPLEIIRQLKISPTIEDKRGGRERLDEMKKNLDNAIDILYQEIDTMSKLANTQDPFFTGSDIWMWFLKSAEVYLKPDARNYIICLSDGYLDFNDNIQRNRRQVKNKTNYTSVSKFRDVPNWKEKFHVEEHGLLEIGKDFSGYDVKFLMVEIKLRGDEERGIIYTQDFEIIKEYWQTWLKSMGIAKSQFLLTQDDPQRVIEKIKEFISN